MVSTRKEQTHEKLLEAAWKRLERGDPAKLDDVAADVGVSRQAVYLHFGSRGGLLLELVSHIDEKLRIGARVGVALAQADPVKRLEAVLGVLADFEPEIHGVAMALVRLSDGDPDVRAALDDRMRIRQRGLSAIVEELAAAGRLRKEWSKSEVVDALWIASASSSYEHLVVERSWNPSRYRDWLVWVARSFLKLGASNESAPRRRKGRSGRP